MLALRTAQCASAARQVHTNTPASPLGPFQIGYNSYQQSAALTVFKRHSCEEVAFKQPSDNAVLCYNEIIFTGMQTLAQYGSSDERSTLLRHINGLLRNTDNSPYIKENLLQVVHLIAQEDERSKVIAAPNHTHNNKKEIPPIFYKTQPNTWRQDEALRQFQHMLSDYKAFAPLSNDAIFAYNQEILHSMDSISLGYDPKLQEKLLEHINVLLNKNNYDSYIKEYLSRVQLSLVGKLSPDKTEDTEKAEQTFRIYQNEQTRLRTLQRWADHIPDGPNFME